MSACTVWNGYTVAPLPRPECVPAHAGQAFDFGDAEGSCCGHAVNVDGYPPVVNVLSMFYGGRVTPLVDVAVIGSGFGGLTAASLAARSGMSVSVFERHTRPGGCAGDFALDGFWFPAGATVVTGLEPGGILRRVFEELDVTVDSRPLDPSIVFHVDGKRVPYVASHDGWEATFRLAFPDAPAGYRGFWNWVRDIGGVVYSIGTALPSLPLQSFADVRRTIRAAHPQVLKTLPLLAATLGSIKTRLGATGHREADALIDSLLLDATGATAEECSAIQGAIALDLYRRGCQWVDGGTGALAMSLVRAVRRFGGMVSFGEGIRYVTRLGSIWRLETDAGRPIYARTVIANVPPAGLDRLLGREPRITAPAAAWGAFVLHLGIDAKGLDMPHPFHQVIRGGDLHEAGNSSLVSIFPGRAGNPDLWSISVSTHVETGAGREFSECRRRELEERLLSNVETVIPNVRDRVRLLRSATPQTFERFTSRPGGFVGGLRQVPGVVALRAAGHRPERGLFLAGDHVFPGQGTVGTALSGINAYRDAAEFLGRRPIL